MSSLFSRSCACCIFYAAMAVSSSRAHADCSSMPAPAPKPAASARILDVLQGIPDGTAWIDLPAGTRAVLQNAAAERLAWFRLEWNSDALLKKETILLGCPTPKMTEAMDRYLGHAIADSAPGFSLSRLQNAALRRALVRLYLVEFAAYRASISYPFGTMPNIDWDGQSRFNSFPLPDASAYVDIRGYAATVAQQLREIADNSLSPSERRLRDEARLNARVLRAGSFIAKRGGQDWHLPCQLSGAGYMITMGYKGDKGLPKVFRDEEDAVQEFNAVYLLNTALKWADTGTFPAARDHDLCNSGIDDEIQEFVAVGSPLTAKAMRTLRRWWLERAGANLPAYTTYTASDRETLWEAFTAEQRVRNDDDTSMAKYAGQVDEFRRVKVASYRQVAAAAVQAVFPNNAVLTVGQKERVLQAITNEEAFGRFKEQIALMLDAAQGTKDGPAANIWKETVRQKVHSLGGLQDGNLRPADVAKAKVMFGEVQDWLLKRYRNYPIPIDPVLKQVKLVLTDDGSASTDQSGVIRLGLATPRSLLEYYSLMLHELRHAVRAAAIAHAPDPSKVATDDGIAAEGSGVAAEDLLRVPLLRDVLEDETAVLLYQLDFAIRDARFIATTEATLRRYFREGCGTPECPSTVEAARTIAYRYGLTGRLADTLVTRSHIGTHYFQYIFAGEQMKAELAFLAQAIRPVDPYILFACGLNMPQRSAEYVSKLRDCLRKNP